MADIAWGNYEGCAGIDVGASSVKIGVVAGGSLKQTRFNTPCDWELARSEIVRIVKELGGGSRLNAVGVGSPGPLDWRTGVLGDSPNLEWKGVRYKEHLRRDLECDVWVDNDANVAGLAETLYGAGRGHHVVCGYTLGTGVGYFVVIGGAVHHGRKDVEGGHVVLDPDGPQCGCKKDGCLEAYVGAASIKVRYGVEPKDLKDTRAWEEIARLIALGISQVDRTVCPEVFILGGGVSVRGDALLIPIHKYLQEYSRIYEPVPVLFAEFGEDAGVIGAVLLAKQGQPDLEASKRTSGL